MAKVFIGSTSRDLSAYRQAAIDECNRLGLVPVAMEFFEALGVGATAGSRRKLDEADVYVGIFAHRYGFIEPSEAASVTEIEFDHAKTRGLDRLCFLVDLERGDPALRALAEPEHRARVVAFRARVEGTVIRELFTSVDDFRGKVRPALQAWMRRTPALRGPQPPLSFQLLEPTPENRLRYGARRTPFVGRWREIEALRSFLDEKTGLSWLVVSGPGGAGKSRLAQELCTRVSPPWRAGFLLADPAFADWSAWQPEAPTLIVIDYAAERTDEIRALLGALVHRGADAFARMPVRVLLVERDAAGPWLDRVIGNRSAGYAFEQTRSPRSSVEVGPLSDDELWQQVAPLLGTAWSPGFRGDLLAALHALDPQRRPLFALLAADAVAAGRTIGAWDRDRLLRDVLGREREGWEARGATVQYGNLLALATVAGGLTEEVLAAPPPGVPLPSFPDFDRAILRIMNGADLGGDAVPPLKPDLLGEFFVLERVRGRNERTTARLAAELAAAAWRLRGGGQRVYRFGLTHVTPTPVPLFLLRIVDDYVDHPATPHLLARPEGDGLDLFFWPELAAHGVRRFVEAGRTAEALALFAQLTALTPEEQRLLLGTSAIVAAAFALLPRALGPDPPVDAADLLGHLDAVELHGYDGTATAYTRGVADAVPGLLAAGRADLIETLLARVAAVAAEQADGGELRAQWARATAQRVTHDGPLRDREAAYERLVEFCRAHPDDIALYVYLARAAGALCRVYAAEPAHAADADRMNRVIRELARRRAEGQLVSVTASLEGALPFRSELVLDDLRAIRLELAETNVMLLPAFVAAGRDREASDLIDEIDRLAPRRDADFAALWAHAVGRHADSIAARLSFEQVPKALAAIREVAAAFPDDRRFPRIASTLALATLTRAVERHDGVVADAMYAALQAAGSPDGAEEALVADYAEGALTVAVAQQDRGEVHAAILAVRAARAALRSPAARARWLGRGEAAAEEVARWLDAMDAAGEAQTLPVTASDPAPPDGGSTRVDATNAPAGER